MEDSFNKKIVKKQIKEYMNSERYIHTIQVSKIAVELAIANNISVQKA
jgi:HD superfamily phosphohydrolase YqeK